MRLKEPIEVKLNDEFSIIAQNVWLNNRGVPAVEAYVWNGEPIYSDTLCPANSVARRRFIRSVMQRGVSVTEQQIESGLLLIGSNLSTKFADELESEQAKDNRAPSQATQLVQLAEDAEFFHTPDGEAYASIEVAGHRETWPVKVKGFRRYLSRRFYENTRTSASTQALQDALSVLEGKALFDGPEKKVYTRVSEYEDRVYVDLANDKWEAVEITASGWRVVADPPVKFRRAKGMGALPHPVAGSSIDGLRAFINIATDDDWILLCAWLVQAIRPRGPYPIGVLQGEQGSAKSTAGRVLRSLIDPYVASLRSQPRCEHDLMIAATNGWCVALDNLSNIPVWLSDALCRLATGGGFATRELYSDSEEVLFDAQRPVLINGIEELAARGDLLDRTINIYLPQIIEEQRRPEDEFWPEFETARPQILGALYTSVSAAMRIVDTVKLKRLPRMADFAIWATAAESALGFEAGTFINAYTRNRESANDLALESSLVAPAIQAFIEKEIVWAGAATDLLDALNELGDEETRRKRERQRTWPKSPQALSNTLRRLAPNLRVAGVSVEFYRTGKKKTIRLEHACNSSSSSSSSSPPESSTKESVKNEKFNSGTGYPTGDDGVTTGDDGQDYSSSRAKSKKTQGEGETSDASDDGDDEKRPYSKAQSSEIVPCPTCGEEGERLTDCENCGDLIR